MGEQSASDFPDGREMTLEEWGELPDDAEGELVDGWLVEEEMPGYVHEIIVGWLIRILGNWIAPRGGLVGGSDARFAVRPRRGRKPDVTVFLPGSRLPSRQGLVRVPPDIAIEVVSPTHRDHRRDRIDKVEDYAVFGVRWYWIVDPEMQSIEVLERNADGRYVHAFAATGGTHRDVPGCPELVLDLDGLWAEVARLADEGGEQQ